jgi:membrane protein YqaA with SNARE-associated domain
LLKLHPELFWPAILLGTLGNILGGMITFGMTVGCVPRTMVRMVHPT